MRPRKTWRDMGIGEFDRRMIREHGKAYEDEYLRTHLGLIAQLLAALYNLGVSILEVLPIGAKPKA